MARTVGSAIDLYMRSRRAELRPATRQGIGYTLDRFGGHIGSDMAVRAVKPRHVSHWEATLARLSPRSARVEISRVRTFFRWLLEQRIITHDPTISLRPPKPPRSLPRELDNGSVLKATLACPDERARVIVSLMLWEGLRRGEVAGLQLHDLDWMGRMIHVIGKGGVERWVPLSTESASAISDYLTSRPASSGPLIRSYKRPGGVEPQTIGRLVIDVFQNAGIKQRPHDGISGHALRHTAAGDMLDHGADVRDVSAFLGHSSIAVTAVYLKRRVAASRLREIMDRRTTKPPAEAGGNTAA